MAKPHKAASPEVTIPPSDDRTSRIGRLIQWTRIARLPLAYLAAFAILAISLYVGVRDFREENRLQRQRELTQDLSAKVKQLVFTRFEDEVSLLAERRAIQVVTQDESEANKLGAQLVMEFAVSSTKADMVYVMNRRGTVVACTEYGRDLSLEGNNYSFRPYFVQAMEGRRCAYPALGVTTQERGIYFSAPIYHSGSDKPAGVVVSKVNASLIELMMRDVSDSVALISPEGVIFASNRPEWLYRTLDPISPGQLQQIHSSKQYADKPIKPFPGMVQNAMVQVNATEYTISRESVHMGNRGQWQIVTFQDVDTPVSLTRAQAVFVAVVGVMFGLFTVGMWAMKVIKDHLKLIVENRTADLRRAISSVEHHVSFLQGLLDGIPNPVFYEDKDLIYRGCNVAFEKLLGRTRDQIIGRTVFDVGFTERTAHSLHQAGLWLLKHGGSRQRELTFTKPNGEASNALYNSAVFYDSQGKPAGLISVMIDITERKRMEIALRRSQKRFQDITDVSGEFIYEMNMEGKFTYLSERVERMLGYSSKELLHQSPFDFVHEEDLPEVRGQFGQAAISGRAFRDLEYRSFHKEGKLVWLSVSGEPIYDSAGQIHGYRGTGRDITYGKLAAEELEASRQQWEKTFNSVPDMIAVLDKDHRILRANEAFANSQNLPVAELIGRKCNELLHPDGAVPDFCPFNQMLGDGQSHECEYHDSRTNRDLWVTVTCMRDDAGEFVGAVHIIRDITRQKEAERTLQKTVGELERFNQVAVGRELRMLELKKEVNRLAELTNQEKPYDVSFADKL